MEDDIQREELAWQSEIKGILLDGLGLIKKIVIIKKEAGEGAILQKIKHYIGARGKKYDYHGLALKSADLISNARTYHEQTNSFCSRNMNGWKESTKKQAGLLWDYSIIIREMAEITGNILEHKAGIIQFSKTDLKQARKEFNNRYFTACDLAPAILRLGGLIPKNEDIFSSCNDHDNKREALFEKAKKLTWFSKMHAVSSITPLVERFPVLETVDVENWDFIVTIAGVFVAVNKIENLNLKEEQKEKIVEIIMKNLNQFNCNAIRGLEDCKFLFNGEFGRFSRDGHDPRFIESDALGQWIVVNVLGHWPKTAEECELVRAVGFMISQAHANWWDN